MRKAENNRKTNETDIFASLTIEGDGEYSIETPIGFLTHMLETFTRHGNFNLNMKASGDLHVDQHHLVEDTGIVLGNLFKKALGDRRGIKRAGFFVFPMDDALSLVSLDISGRSYLLFNAEFERRYCGELDTDLVIDFFRAFSTSLEANIVIKILDGENDHHKLEAIFKGFARALSEACSINQRNSESILSTKGILKEKS